MAEVKVVVRFRPENELERATGGQPCVDIQDQDSLVLKVCVPTSNLRARCAMIDPPKARKLNFYPKAGV